MIEWIKNNYPLIPGIILIIISQFYYKRKVKWWVSFGDKYEGIGKYFIIMGIILLFIGIFIRDVYLNNR